MLWPVFEHNTLYKFKVFNTVHHRTIQINHQSDATIFQFNIMTFIYSSTCFGRFPAHHQELNDCSDRLWFYLRILVTVVLCSWSARPRTQHDCHHDTKGKPEAATAVIELLMMGGKTPETCWVVNKCQDNKLENCCIWLVIYLNCTMKHGLTNLKLSSRCCSNSQRNDHVRISLKFCNVKGGLNAELVCGCCGRNLQMFTSAFHRASHWYW
jgi:hypothetical protein